MKKSFVSNQDKWVDLSRNWSASYPIEDFLPGVIAVDDVNRILNNAPSDVGGSIRFGVTRNEVEDLINRRQISLNFSSSIHYEAAQLVDTPYTKKVNVVMEDFYELDPKDFRTEKPFLWIERGDSLEELLVETINDSVAKKSYKALVKTLNNDKPDASLKDIIEDANYWAAEFAKAVDARELADDFITEHSKKWDSYSGDEKLEALNDYAGELGDLFDKNRWYDFLSGRDDLITEVRWFTDDPNYSPSDAYGYTYSTRADGIVYLNDNFKNSIDSIYDLSKVVTTVTHECQHQYQGHAVSEDRFNLPSDLTKTWTFDQKKYPDYWTRPWEIDARAWAGFIN